jgi:hypothetical protein
MHEQVQPHGPLTPAVFHILLALHGWERYAYDIMQQVKEDSQGPVKMVLDRLIAAGLVSPMHMIRSTANACSCSKRPRLVERFEVIQNSTPGTTRSYFPAMRQWAARGKEEIMRELQRLELVLGMIKTIEAERDTIASAKTKMEHSNAKRFRI